jgi:hypothetical protein
MRPSDPSGHFRSLSISGVPDNIPLLYSTPALCTGVAPDGKRVGNLSANKLCSVVWDTYDAIVEACR